MTLCGLAGWMVLAGWPVAVEGVAGLMAVVVPAGCAGAETLSGASPAYLFHRIGASEVTILLDEADAIWKRGKSDDSAEALRSIVNAGHRRSATVGRVEMNGQKGTLTRFPVYAPAAIAGIGTCLTPSSTGRWLSVRRRAGSAASPRVSPGRMGCSEPVAPTSAGQGVPC